MAPWEWIRYLAKKLQESDDALTRATMNIGEKLLEMAPNVDKWVTQCLRKPTERDLEAAKELSRMWGDLPNGSDGGAALSHAIARLRGEAVE